MKLPLACVMILALACSVALGQQAPARANDSAISAAFVHDTVASLQKLLQEKYFDTSAIPRLEAALAADEQRGTYANAKDLADFSAKLSETLDQVAHDKHLWVKPSDAARATAGAPQLPRAERGRMENYGIRQAEILDGNVGYLRMTGFYHPDEAAVALATAMNFLKHTDALILDFRNNGGGSPDTVALMLSYFFKQPNLPLFSIIPRAGKTESFATDVSNVAYRDESRPLYVLVSGETGSGGEGVPYILQASHRATIIGETTLGGANVARPFPLNSSLSVNLPLARLEVAVNKSNWEKVGVIPDTKVPAADALNVAYVDALEKLMKLTTDAARKQVLSPALSAARKLEGQKTPIDQLGH